MNLGQAAAAHYVFCDISSSIFGFYYDVALREIVRFRAWVLFCRNVIAISRRLRQQ
jgi:hypothetical protein